MSLATAQVEWHETVLSTQYDGPSGISIADLNNDGANEIIATSRYDGTVLYWENIGDQWVETIIDFTLLDAKSPYGADINGDGTTDMVACDHDGDAIYWWERTGDTWTRHTVVTGASGAQEVVAADINQDGLLDLYAVLYHGEQVVWCEQTDVGWEMHIIREDFNYCNQIDAADFDNDGDIDGVACSYTASTFEWYENDGGVFQTHTIDASAADAWSVQALDFDDDGDVDLLGGQLTGEVNWYENSDGTWIPHQIVTNITGVRDAEAADFDLDGDKDVLVATSGSNAVYWYENNLGSWISHTIRAYYDTPWNIHAGDVDNDGDIDALGAAQGWDASGDEFTYWEQLGTPIPPPIDIELHPINTTVPPAGGAIVYGATLTNNTQIPRLVDAWTGVELPNGQVFVPLSRRRGTLPVGPFELFNLSLEIPAEAPSGTYIFTGYIGNISYGVIADRDSFIFTKTGLRSGATDPSSWSHSPWNISGEQCGPSVSGQPTDFTLSPGYPNPFNSNTTVRVSLPETTNLSIKIYAATGRLVTQLVNAEYGAGTHSFLLDGSDLATGLYFIKAEVTGEIAQIQKLVLVK